MADVVASAQQEIVRRLKELEPLVAEYDRLVQADEALSNLDGTPTRRRRGRPGGKRGATARAAKTVGRRSSKRAAGGGRRKGSGARATEALSVVKEQPGITIPEIAAKMGIKQNYLYRVLPGLEKEGKVSKRGRGWHAK